MAVVLLLSVRSIFLSSWCHHSRMPTGSSCDGDGQEEEDLSWCTSGSRVSSMALKCLLPLSFSPIPTLCHKSYHLNDWEVGDRDLKSLQLYDMLSRYHMTDIIFGLRCAKFLVSLRRNCL